MVSRSQEVGSDLYIQGDGSEGWGRPRFAEAHWSLTVYKRVLWLLSPIVFRLWCFGPGPVYNSEGGPSPRSKLHGGSFCGRALPDVTFSQCSGISLCVHLRSAGVSL